MLNGIDVASYQSKLNPSKLTTTDFVIVKFTQGTTYLNPYAEDQYNGSKSAGKLLGAYHYAGGGNAAKEAQYFVSKVGSGIGECILALDWEGMQNPVFGSGKDVAWCKAWLDEVYSLTGVRAFIYMSKSVCRAHNWTSVAKNYPLWCAQYASNSSTNYRLSPWTDSNSFGAWSRDTIRQYSSKGAIAGYSGNIDINAGYLTADQWRAMAAGDELPQETTEEETDEGLPTLTKGDKGKAVKVIQAILGGLSIDGDFGWKTLNAVVLFQKAHDLEADGIVGEKTWEALLSTL